MIAAGGGVHGRGSINSGGGGGQAQGGGTVRGGLFSFTGPLRPERCAGLRIGVQGDETRWTAGRVLL